MFDASPVPSAAMALLSEAVSGTSMARCPSYLSEDTTSDWRNGSGARDSENMARFTGTARARSFRLAPEMPANYPAFCASWTVCGMGSCLSCACAYVKAG